MAGSVEDEFSEFVAQRWAALVRAGMLLGCSTVEAEDVAQTALARCLSSWSRVRRASDRDAYVHRILVNTFIDLRRPRSSRETPVATTPDRAGVAADDVVRLDVERSLGRLPFDQRTAVAECAACLDVGWSQSGGPLLLANGYLFDENTAASSPMSRGGLPSARRWCWEAAGSSPSAATESSRAKRPVASRK